MAGECTVDGLALGKEPALGVVELGTGRQDSGPQLPECPVALTHLGGEVVEDGILEHCPPSPLINGVGGELWQFFVEPCWFNFDGGCLVLGANLKTLVDPIAQRCTTADRSN